MRQFGRDQRRAASPSFSRDKEKGQTSVRRYFKPRRFLVFALMAIALGLLGTVGWLSYRANAALDQISDSDDKAQGLLSFLTKPDDAKLKGETDGRINVLFLGMGGKGHPGGQLTDTIMVASILPDDGKVALISLPRDLYIPIPDHGYGKLNSAHAIGEQAETGGGPALAKEAISDLIGMPIHYYVRIDFDGFVKLVDALGGLDVTVENAISDPYFPADDMISYDPFYIKAGPTHMSGSTALKYARSRETTSDFDRARRQQQLIKAIKDKAFSASVLLNPAKLSEFLNILGNHVRTDLAAWEMERFLELSQNLDGEKFTNKVFDTATGSPLTSRSDERAGYIIVPRTGNFNEFRAEVKNIFSEDDEALATIAIENASGTANLGGNVALLLRGYGYQVTSVTTAKSVRATSRLVAKDAAAYPKLQDFLQDRFGVAAETTSPVPTTDFVLIIGKDYAPTL